MLFSLAPLDCFLLHTRITCLRVGVVPLTAIWALLHQSLIKKMFHSLVYRPIWGGTFSQLRPLFPDNSSLCQVDKTKAKIMSIFFKKFKSRNFIRVCVVFFRTFLLSFPIPFPPICLPYCPNFTLFMHM